jgi:hypothetical protein
MANTFKNYTASSVGTGGSTVYTVPGAASAVVIGMNLANVAVGQILVDVQLGSTYLVKGVPIPAGTALSVLDGKMVLEATNTITVTSNTASSVDVILSVLEQT